MSAVKSALIHEPESKTEAFSDAGLRRVQLPPKPVPTAIESTPPARIELPPRLPNVISSADPQPRPVTARPQSSAAFQPKIPVVQGEASYRGRLVVDGTISGQLDARGSTIAIKQRPRAESEPELDGEFSFKDTLRVNGHIAGRVRSEKGTLMVSTTARVDASIDVAVALISGRVNGDVVGRQRVELGPQAVVQGNITTRSISIKPGATFHGDCRILNANDQQ